MIDIKIGDRVYWYTNIKIIGTIKEIYLSDYPFYVIWDDGKDDCYIGSVLRKIL